MKRREFLQTLIGGAAGLAFCLPAVSKQANRERISDMLPDLSSNFPRYTQFDPVVPVWCATPNTGRTLHRFFDTSPFSPSGRYLGLTRIPSEDHLPKPGDVAEVVIVDLQTGEEKVVAETRGWETQLGAQVQWGTDETELFFNDVDPLTWRAFGVKLDPLSGVSKKLDGTIYMASPAGGWAASACLLRMRITQGGYGVIVPIEKVPLNDRVSDEDGVYVTNTSTGESRLLVSIREIVETATPAMDMDEYKDGAFYGFHVKWNPSGDRLMLVLRWLPSPGANRRQKLNVITMKSDGSEIHVAIPTSKWSKGGHHPNWCPDGEDVMMNLNLYGNGLRFVRARYDGSNLRAMVEDIMGSGHPTLHPDGRYIVTDAYPSERVAFGDGTTPIRLIDLNKAEEKVLVRIRIVPDRKVPGELRIDPHPAWDYQYKRIAFNGFVDGTRRVYIADLSSVLEK